jgi:hypothetical protein
MDVVAIRAQVVEELVLLSEPSRQVAYEQALRNHAGVAHVELREVYPSMFNLKSPTFIAAFTEPQLNALAHLYGLFMELRPRDFTSVGEMLKDLTWRRIIHVSQELRQSLEHGA